MEEDPWDMPGTGAIEIDLEAIRAASAGGGMRVVTALSGARTGQVIKLDEAKTIGRHPECDIVLLENGVSRHHATLESRGDAAVVVDHDSTNGTFVNGQRIYDPTELRDGDRIQVGATTILRYAVLDKLDVEFQQKQYESATRDALTGCFTKRYLLEHIATDVAFAIRHHEMICVVMLDLDHFKNINDSFGHPAGDYVLTTLGALLLEQARKEDVVARYGGEEFAIVLRNTSASFGEIVAERIRTAVERTSFVWGSETLPVTTSIGVAAGPRADIQAPEQLISLADEMLYKAKRSGRNRVACATGVPLPH